MTIVRKSSSRLTHQRLVELVTLDHTTGLLTRRIHMGRRGRAGTLVKPSDKGDRYRVGSVGGELHNYAHLVWLYVYGCWPTEIDHINGDPSDNRPANLRLANRAQNMQARKEYRSNKTGYRGVCLNAWGRYQAAISVNGKKRHIGVYDTPEEAYDAWCAAAARLRGEFACFD